MQEMMKNYFVHESSYIDKSCVIGDGTKVWHFCHILENTQIGPNCSLGQNVMVGAHVTLGSGVKVQNNVSIYEGVECEEDVFLGPSVVFTNISNPRSFIVRRQQFKKTLLKKGCSIGANATILCGLTIGEYSLVGAGSTVTKDIPPFGLVYGVPSKLKGWVSKAGNKLEFNSNGRTIDKFDGSQYLLQDGVVTMVSL